MPLKHNTILPSPIMTRNRAANNPNASSKAVSNKNLISSIEFLKADILKFNKEIADCYNKQLNGLSDDFK